VVVGFASGAAEFAGLPGWVGRVARARRQMWDPSETGVDRAARLPLGVVPAAGRSGAVPGPSGPGHRIARGRTAPDAGLASTDAAAAPGCADAALGAGGGVGPCAPRDRPEPTETYLALPCRAGTTGFAVAPDLCTGASA